MLYFIIFTIVMITMMSDIDTNYPPDEASYVRLHRGGYIFCSISIIGYSILMIYENKQVNFCY